MCCWFVGKPVYGVSGELVCTKPFPSMPTHFWKDTDGTKYNKAYFNKYPGLYNYNASVNGMPQGGENGQTMGILTQNKNCFRIPTMGYGWKLESSTFPRDHTHFVFQNSIWEFPRVNITW